MILEREALCPVDHTLSAVLRENGLNKKVVEDIPTCILAREFDAKLEVLTVGDGHEE